MSEETRRNLESAVEAAENARAEAEVQKKACLEEAAAALPSRVQAVAKQVALAEPDVTRSLGAEGIGALRNDLTRESEGLAEELRAAVQQVEWPGVSRSMFASVNNDRIRTALTNFLRGDRTKKLTAVFKSHGFTCYDYSSRPSRGRDLPDSLVENLDVDAVVEALNDVNAAERQLVQAKTADDTATVDELWGD
jgi:hypothetical protein